MTETTNLYISQNPYRIISVLSNSGIKEIHKNLSKLKAYSKLNKTIELEYDLNHLNLSELDRDNDTITKVESRILLDENKVKYSLFWFLDIASYDSIAIANLVKGNDEKAIEIWKKAIKSDEISSKNYSAFNNISTLLMLLSLDESKTDLFSNSKESIYNLKQAINYKELYHN
jgi:tetratricopeptide (TPR) repeat protein